MKTVAFGLIAAALVVADAISQTTPHYNVDMSRGYGGMFVVAVVVTIICAAASK